MTLLGVALKQVFKTNMLEYVNVRLLLTDHFGLGKLFLAHMALLNSGQANKGSTLASPAFTQQGSAFAY